jgi:hypothetical protein
MFSDSGSYNMHCNPHSSRASLGSLCWRLTLVVGSLLLLTTFLTQARSSATSVDLHPVLLRENCPPPCFMGIRPGVTAMTEAVTILQALPWVEHLEIGYNPSGQPNTLHWQWSAASPLRPDPRSASFVLSADRLDDRVPLVMSVTLHTANPLGEAVLALGHHHQTRSGHNGWLHRTYVMFLYAHLNILLFSEVDCPLQSHALWNAPVRIEYRAELRVADAIPLHGYCRSLHNP